MTTPSHWTSTYNDAFRDRTKFISPNSSQPMYHFKGTYDKSHYTSDRSGGSNVATAYQTAYAQFDGMSANAIQQAILNESGSATSNNAAFAATVAASEPAVVCTQTPTLTMSHGIVFPKAVPGGKDLWNSRPNPTHGGIVPINGPAYDSNLPYIPAGSSASSSAGFESGSSTSAGDLIGTGDSGSASWTRPKYHVPGYSGFVRGAQFRFGDTYGKTTRMALDVPTDLPLEP